ncbi:MAG TPA: 50S ribosomal protein L11 methyltransferase [Candidatus Binataceae bacterium]|nr:50S ribosomal protein L11 methyltransferase [Candidatus Binataceae bacterium]HVB80020.1 50S ribosomal protein L11 methyltransferase [Candidatus Binataceae bacterium]
MERSSTRGGRTYQKVAYTVKPELADEAAAILIAHGALGCAVRTGREFLRPGMESWDDDDSTPPPPPRHGARSKATQRLEAFFIRVTAARLGRINRALVAAGVIDGGIEPRSSLIVDPGWATRWQSRFKPLAVGRRLLIVPPWSAADRRGRMRLVINPAQAFGTGHHGSTAGALVMLERLCGRLEFRDALDVGCGSGILAIAMRLFGVPRVIGIDSDRIAIGNARENLALNDVTSIRFSSAPVGRIRRRFDLVVANILSTTLIELAPILTRLMKPGARLILGGILERERAAVLRHFRPGLVLDDQLVDHGWVTLAMRR